MKIITGQNDRLGTWLCERQDYAEWVPGRGQAIGLETAEGELIAVVLFDDYNKANINMHVAAVPGSRWLTREFLWYCFHYPFIELGCKRITGLVAETNYAARKFDEHLGFTLEATLKDAHPDGDLLLYVMTKQDCKWIHLKDKRHGKKESPSTA